MGPAVLGGFVSLVLEQVGLVGGDETCWMVRWLSWAWFVLSCSALLETNANANAFGVVLGTHDREMC